MPGRALLRSEANVALRTSSGSRRRSSPLSSIRSKALVAVAVPPHIGDWHEHREEEACRRREESRRVAEYNAQ